MTIETFYLKFIKQSKIVNSKKKLIKAKSFILFEFKREKKSIIVINLLLKYN